MKAFITNKIRAVLLLLLICISFSISAQEIAKGFNLNEPVDDEVNPIIIWSAIGGGFAIALTVFLIAKSKYDKKQRLKEQAQMKARQAQPSRTRSHHTRKA
jgi:heme exporter protein D